MIFYTIIWVKRRNYSTCIRCQMFQFRIKSQNHRTFSRVYFQSILRVGNISDGMATTKAPWVPPQGLQGTLHEGGSLSFEGIDYGLHSTAAATGQTLATLTHLWTLAHSTIMTAPQLSQTYMCKFYETCVTEGIPLHPSVEKAFCKNCGTIRVFGVNCRARSIKVHLLFHSHW